MNYSNIEKLTAVIVEWAKPMADVVVADRLGSLQPVISANEWVKKYFPVAANYSIVNDLSFLALPALKMMVKPAIVNATAKIGLKDEDIPSYVSQIVDALIKEADKNGKVTVFNTLEFEKSDFEKLRYLLNKNLPNNSAEEYQVQL